MPTITCPECGSTVLTDKRSGEFACLCCTRLFSWPPKCERCAGYGGVCGKYACQKALPDCECDDDDKMPPTPTPPCPWCHGKGKAEPRSKVTA